jgi:hypothetical protein
VIAAIASALCVGCGGAADPTTPSDIYTGSIAVQTFSGTLAVGGSSFYSFTVPKDGPASLTLLDLQEDGASSEAAISIGLGTPAGVGCSVSTAVTVSPGPTPQLTSTVGPGVYCAKVADVGNLSGPGRFSVNITRPQ